MDAEPRFEPYTRSLFGPGALGLDRDARSADENARLDGLLAGFLQLLSGFFLAPGAAKALEFLIRQYRRAPAEGPGHARWHLGRAESAACLQLLALLLLPAAASLLLVLRSLGCFVSG